MARASQKQAEDHTIPADDIADPAESPDPTDKPSGGGVLESAKRDADRHNTAEREDLVPVATVASQTLEPAAPRSVGYDHGKGEYLSK